MLRTLLLVLLFAGAGRLSAATGPEIESALAAAVQSPQVTIVHCWAPWCPNCKAELADGAWARFMADNPAVKVIFVTLWSPLDGRAVLAKYGVGAQANFTLLVHPNPSRRSADRVSTLVGLPISWIPTTWIFRGGQLRYALNYGELHFPMLQQLVTDTSSRWAH